MLRLSLSFVPIGECIEDIQIFQWISSSEAKNAHFMSCKATDKIYFFSLHEMK